MFRITSLGLVALATTFLFSSAAAQAGPDGCTYVRCFLSLQRHPPRLVQGAGATPVADFGMFAPRIDLLSSSSDSARLHYEAFRGDYNRAGTFGLISLLTDVSALIVLAGNPRANYRYSLELFAVGLPTGIGALVFGAKAQRQIEQSIADYNRSLPDAR
jgi:hypothetical protein